MEKIIRWLLGVSIEFPCIRTTQRLLSGTYPTIGAHIHKIINPFRFVNHNQKIELPTVCFLLPFHFNEFAVCRVRTHSEQESASYAHKQKHYYIYKRRRCGCQSHFMSCCVRLEFQNASINATESRY